MPATEHVRLIEQIADHFNTGALDAITQLVSPSLTGFTRDLALLRQAFPDARFTIEDILAEGDKLADRYTISGTHARPFLGIPPPDARSTSPGSASSGYPAARSPNAGPSPTSSASSGNSAPCRQALRHEPPPPRTRCTATDPKEKKAQS